MSESKRRGGIRWSMQHMRIQTISDIAMEGKLKIENEIKNFNKSIEFLEEHT